MQLGKLSTGYSTVTNPLILPFNLLRFRNRKHATQTSQVQQTKRCKPIYLDQGSVSQLTDKFHHATAGLTATHGRMHPPLSSPRCSHRRKPVQRPLPSELLLLLTGCLQACQHHTQSHRCLENQQQPSDYQETMPSSGCEQCETACSLLSPAPKGTTISDIPKLNRKKWQPEELT